MEYVNANVLLEHMRSLDISILKPSPDDFATLDEEYWKKVYEEEDRLHKKYVKECEGMRIDPVSGRSTMSWEERNKPFTL